MLNITPLHQAARYGNDKIVLSLIEAGADVNAYSELYGTPLHWAVESNRRDIVEVLIQHGANTDITDDRQLTPTELGQDCIFPKQMHSTSRQALADYLDGDTPSAEFLRLFTLSNSSYLSLGKCLVNLLDPESH